jgi:hypothetical protein
LSWVPPAWNVLQMGFQSPGSVEQLAIVVLVKSQEAET